MKKVLIVFNHPAPYKVRLFNELSKYCDLHVSFERDKNKDRSASFYNENLFDFKTIKINGLKLGKENIVSCGVKNHIKNNKYDLIIMNGYSQFAEIKAIRYMQKHSVPYVLFINGGIIKDKECSCKRKLKSKLISNASMYLSPDEESNKYLVYYGAGKEKIFNYPYSTIYKNEILAKPISDKEKQVIRNKYGLEGKRVFVSAGQLIKRKNYELLINSWKDMPSDHHLYIFGDGKERHKYEKIIAENELNNVHLQGFLPRNELLKVFSISDMFLFPSSEDIYGHVINEALSQGLPVISNYNVNSAKALIDKSNGALTKDFSAKNILSLTDSVLKQYSFNDCVKTAHQNTIEINSQVIAKHLGLDK